MTQEEPRNRYQRSSSCGTAASPNNRKLLPLLSLPPSQLNKPMDGAGGKGGGKKRVEVDTVGLKEGNTFLPSL